MHAEFDDKTQHCSWPGLQHGEASSSSLQQRSAPLSLAGLGVPHTWWRSSTVLGSWPGAPSALLKDGIVYKESNTLFSQHLPITSTHLTPSHSRLWMTTSPSALHATLLFVVRRSCITNALGRSWRCGSSTGCCIEEVSWKREKNQRKQRQPMTSGSAWWAGAWPSTARDAPLPPPRPASHPPGEAKGTGRGRRTRGS